MKKRVGIVRAASHTEITYSECIILKQFKDTDFTFFIERNEYEQLKEFHDNFKFIIIDKYFFVENKKFFNNFDILLFDVAELYLKEISRIDNKSLKIFRIHNLNFWLNNNQTLLNILFDNMRNIFLFFTIKKLILIPLKLFYQMFKKEKRYRSKILEQCEYLSFCNDNQYEYASHLDLDFKYAKLPTFYYVGNKNYVADSKKIKIVVPGELTPEKKDFQVMIEALILLQDNAKDFEIIIFNSKENNSIFTDEILNSNNFCNFVVYDKFVEQNKFVNILNSSHVMLAPIKETVKYRGVKEKFGLSKTSGSYGDFYRYGLVPIFPQSYKIDTEVSEYFELYSSSKSLCEILIKISNKEFLNYRKHRIHEYLTKKNKVIIKQYSFLLNEMR